jgi:aspartate aminotransferase-like enzyme
LTTNEPSNIVPFDVFPKKLAPQSMKSHPLFEKLRIFAPGPTPVPESILLELARSPLHHRTKEFIKILDRTKAALSFLFQTSQRSYLLSASGTGAMEAVLVNLFSAGEEVLVINGGKFGERWGNLSDRFGLKTRWLNIEWGRAADPAQVISSLKNHPQIKGVLFQASETSTGVYHPVHEIAEAVRAHSDALIVVDAITGLGVVDLPMDEWKVDAVISGSQKALMLPPGLSFFALSEKAQQRRKLGTNPRFYFDLDAEDEAAQSGETPWTPAVSLICGLDVVLARMQQVGLAPVFAHHAKLAEASRRGFKALGLELFAQESPSNALTAVKIPPAISDGGKVISYLRDRFGLTIAGGQDAWKGKMFRFAHLGFYDELDILTGISAIEITLKKLGAPCELGKGVAAAADYFLTCE